MRRLLGMAAAAALALGACTFAPDLSRFPRCGEGDACPPGYTCLATQGLCVRDCAGEGACGGNDGGPSLDAAPLDAGVEARPYSHRFTAQGGIPPYWFSAAQPLPAGFSLSDAGLLSAGEAGDAGSHPLTIEVRDSAALVDGRTFTLQVRPLLRVAGPAILARAFQGEPYAEALSATGGTPRPPQARAYLFTLDGGWPVAGLQLSAQGALTGTPADGGTFLLGIAVADGQGQLAARQVQLTVDVLPAFVGITSGSLPEARAGWPYSFQLRTRGAMAAVTWSLTGGSFPPGIGLDMATGLVSGATAVPGTYNVTVQATDGTLLTDTASFALKVEGD